MRLVCIMQPHFLPWAGYMNLIHNSNEFVFLNDVYFQKQSWQTRNRILINGQVKYISFPIKGQSSKKLITEVELDNHELNLKKVIRKIEQSYARSPFKSDLTDVLDIIASQTTENLVTLNTNLISDICVKLSINAEFHHSENFAKRNSRVARIVDIIKSLSADIYVSPAGSEEYLTASKYVQETSVPVSFQEFHCGVYTQQKVDSFQSHLSIVDVIANIGFSGAEEYVKNGWSFNENR